MTQFASELKKHFQKPENTHKATGNLDRFVFAVGRKMRSNGVSANEFQAAKKQVQALVNESLIEQGHQLML